MIHNGNVYLHNCKLSFEYDTTLYSSSGEIDNWFMKALEVICIAEGEEEARAVWKTLSETSTLSGAVYILESLDERVTLSVDHLNDLSTKMVGAEYDFISLDEFDNMMISDYVVDNTTAHVLNYLEMSQMCDSAPDDELYLDAIQYYAIGEVPDIFPLQFDDSVEFNPAEY